MRSYVLVMIALFVLPYLLETGRFQYRPHIPEWLREKLHLEGGDN